MERDEREKIITPVIENFNSHAHVERDVVEQAAFAALDISTHTLTWSVTCLLSPPVPLYAISTHTLTWSVTKCFSLNAWERTNFNSHAHVERDRSGMALFSWSTNFNSHAHVERDLYTLSPRIYSTFQLTRSRGA